MLIDEIKSECWHVFILVIIITWGMFFCDIGNREAVWEEKYAACTFNKNPSGGSGFIDSIVCPEKSP